MTTPGDMWWGVDSTVAISDASLDNVRAWYGGASPQFWGRYLTGDYALQPGELEYARARGIYVFLLVPDRNCSQCAGGGDLCASDRTADQARVDAREALAAASANHVPAGAVLFKDIEQVSSCRNEPSADYLIAWYGTVLGSDYRTGFYGNTTEQSWDFPRAFCAAAARDRGFAANVLVDGNEPELDPAPARGEAGPDKAPPFGPFTPDCASAGSTVLWQYAEPADDDNVTDLDEMLPGTPGLLAPDGSVT